MTKTSKCMVLFVIISCLILVAGAVVGTVCHFVGDGFFNYGVDYASDKTVTITFAPADYDSETVEDICEDAFSKAGIKYTEKQDSYGSDYLVYTFSNGTDDAKLESVTSTINETLASDESALGLNVATFAVGEGLETNTGMYKFAAIAAASIIALQFLYCIIRYRLNVAVMSLVTDVHSVAMMLALLAVTRIPFGSYSAPVILIGLLLTMICNQLFYTDVKKNLKNEDLGDATFVERSDMAAKSMFRPAMITCASVAVVCIVFGVAMLIATPALSYAAVALAAVVACICAGYSSAMFAPAVYSRTEKLTVRSTNASSARKEKAAAKEEESN